MSENFEYSEKVIDHFMNPRNMGELEDADGIGFVRSSECGDMMKLFIKVKDDVIVDVKFKTFGCGAAIASSSMATEMVKGKTIEEALKLSNMAVVDALDGLPPIKVHCSVLAEDALKAAIEDYKRKKAGEKESEVFVDCSKCCGQYQKVIGERSSEDSK